MMNLLSYGFCLLALTLPLNAVATGAHAARGFHARGHHDISRRVEGHVQLWKRVSNSKWTFYDVGLGACGKVNVASDYIVALNAAQFGGGYPGKHCFKYITMSYEGKTARAQIMDMCPGCPPGGLDLSRGLFGHFDSLNVGIIFGSWSFDGDGDDEPASNPKPPMTSSRPTTTRTSTRYTPTVTSATRTLASSTLSSTIPTGNTSTISGVDYSIDATSGLAIPVATNVPDDQEGNLDNINEALVGLGTIIVAGARAD